jgi:ribosome modulation factor
MTTIEYTEGWTAKCENKTKKQCPYIRGTIQQKRWHAGWFGANDDPVRNAENDTMH